MFIRFQYILTCWHGSLIRTPFRSNIYFYVICCFFVFFFALFLNLRRKFKLYFSVQCSQTTSPRHLLDTLSKIRNSRVFSNIAYFT